MDRKDNLAIQSHIKKHKDRFDYAGILILEQSGSLVRADKTRAEVMSVPRKRGMVASVLVNKIRFETAAALEDDPVETAKNLLDRCIEKSESVSLHGMQEFIPVEESLEQEFAPVPFEEISLEEKISHANDMVRRIHGVDSSIASVRTMFRHTRNREVYISEKKLLSQDLSRFEAVFLAALKNEQGAAQIFDGYGVPGGWEKRYPPAELIDNLVKDGKKILSAPRLEPGTYDCIFDPSMSGILAHEAFGHGTEADTMMRHRAKGSGYIGKRVASDMVSICDAPSLKNTAASFEFDHEGQTASETCIVDKGFLKNPMTDFASASVLGFTRTANGRRESYDHKVYTRMTNTFFRHGEDSLEDMIASMENGFLVSRATNGMEDPKGWGIQLEALMARRIQNGKLTDDYYSPVIVTGYVPDILNSVSMVSNDFHINGLGMCGKGHKEWVKVTDGGPYLKLRARLA